MRLAACTGSLLRQIKSRVLEVAWKEGGGQLEDDLCPQNVRNPAAVNKNLQFFHMDVSQNSNRITLIPTPNEGKNHRNGGRARAREGRDSNRRERFTFNKTAPHVHLCICSCSKCDLEGCVKASSIFQPHFRDSNRPCSFRFLSELLKINNLDEALTAFVDVSALKSCLKTSDAQEGLSVSVSVTATSFHSCRFYRGRKKKKISFCLQPL